MRTVMRSTARHGAAWCEVVRRVCCKHARVYCKPGCQSFSRLLKPHCPHALPRTVYYRWWLPDQSSQKPNETIIISFTRLLHWPKCQASFSAKFALWPLLLHTSCEMHVHISHSREERPSWKEWEGEGESQNIRWSSETITISKSLLKCSVSQPNRCSTSASKANKGENTEKTSRIHCTTGKFNAPNLGRSSAWFSVQQRTSN